MNRLKGLFGAVAMASMVAVQVLGAGVNDVDVDVKGCIKDRQSKEPLIGATVTVVGSGVATVTDVDGNFALSGLRDGIYDIEIKYVGYKTAVKRQVKVEDNKVTTLDFELETDDRVLSGVEVVAKANRESENVTMMEQKRSVVAVQSVGAQQGRKRRPGGRHQDIGHIQAGRSEKRVCARLGRPLQHDDAQPLSVALGRP